MFGSVLIIATLKGTVMLAVAGLLSVLLRRSSAAVRHALWFTAIVSLLLFSVGNGLEQWQVAILPVEIFQDEIATAVTEAPVVNGSAATPVTEMPAQNDSAQQVITQTGSWQSAILPAMFIFWLMGVILIFARLVAGTIKVRRMVRSATPLMDPGSLALLQDLSSQLGITRRLSVFRSKDSVIPMTCGVWSPVVLLPHEAGEWSEDRRRVVLLHELVHIKRRDLLTQALAQIACALYWFNPLVWLALRQLRKEQEWACDERVLATGVKASDYAGHLLEIGRRFYTRSSPAVTTAIVRHSQLEQRLRAILRPTLQRSPARAKAGAVFTLCAVFLSLAGTQVVSSRSVADHELAGVSAQLDQTGSSQQQAKDRTAKAPAAKRSPENSQSPRPTPSPSPAHQPAANDPGDDQMTAEQVFNSFSVEDRNNLINNGVGPAYIKEMAGAGYRDLTAAQLIALRSNAVRADYVASLESVGYPDLSLRDLLALRTNGITADVIKSFQAVNYAHFQATNFIAFTSNLVPPSYLKSMKGLGYDKLTPKQIVDMWVAGVSDKFIREVRSRGNANPSPEELIEMKKREKP
jgi:beta-lactamase regulating signal transducer with metallopeptidase domain